MSEPSGNNGQLIMTDEQILQQVNHCIENGIVMNLTLMERGLRVQRQLIEKLQADHKTLATGLEPLSRRQAETFDFLTAFINHNGYPPSVREIAKGVGLASSSTVHGHLDRLEAKGYIKRHAESGRPRSMQITGKREGVSN